MRVIAFGTYDTRRHPRIAVVVDGLRGHGVVVEECNRPLGVDTAQRVAAVARPWRIPGTAWRLASAWVSLWRQARGMQRPDAVIVGYLGSLDIHVCRLIWRGVPIVLDHLAFAGDTARDRGIGRPWMVRMLDRIDRWAVAAADTVLVDTEENLALIPDDLRRRGLVVAVGAPDAWFRPVTAGSDGPLRVVFFGLYTPLQGAPVIAEAMALLADRGVAWTMIGTGQDLEATRRGAGPAAQATWIDWVDAADLPDLVGGHDVCLGIFGTGDKARRVVPNKVYQGAAAGCAVVTSDTPPQRRAMADAAVYVPAGDANALCDALATLAGDRSRCLQVRHAARRRAEEEFRPATVVAPLVDRLRWLVAG